MGNENSQPSGLVMEENAIEVTDRWSLHSATHMVLSVGPKISVFVGGTQSSNNDNHTLLEKFSKNLKLYRHPSILKYVSSWRKSSKLYLATEDVKPLIQVLPTQTALQVCIGLQNILKALIFLHEKAQASHNNVCRGAIYVTYDGVWKLGGLEYLCRFRDLSSGYLNNTRQGRYDSAISPGEQDRVPEPPSSVDCYAFGVLAEEVLSAYSIDDVPGMQEFRDTCKLIKSSTPSLRPPLSNLLSTTYFTHEFISIHNFLTELTLKTDVEKQQFFSGLCHKLNMFDESVVAIQLGSLLLSRMVLLDNTAQQHLLPQIFMPKTNINDDDMCTERLFSEKTFKTYIVPKLLPMFCVRDSHVRLILLNNFSSFCSMFTGTQLKTFILPELLVGIKDTNDILVSSTLRALADIVPILGSSVVIGGKSRRKFFADGRPKAAVKNVSSSTTLRSGRSGKQQRQQMDSDHVSGSIDKIHLPERASPDGGEDCNSPILYTGTDEETENWTDWENNVEDGCHTEENNSTGIIKNDQEIVNDHKNTSYQENNVNTIINNNNKLQEVTSDKNIVKSNNSEETVSLENNLIVSTSLSSISKTSSNYRSTNSLVLPDITELDIKSSKSNNSINSNKNSNSKSPTNSSNSRSTNNYEIDYFQDMEPVIISSNKHVIDLVPKSIVDLPSVGNSNNSDNSKFQIIDDNNAVDIGWDDDFDVNDVVVNEINVNNDTNLSQRS